MLSTLKRSLLSLALLALVAPAASADSFGISYTKKSKHGALSLGYSSGPGPSPSLGYARACAPRRVWVPGHYKTVHRRVWIDGCPRTVWVEPAYQFRRDACGRTYPVCISSGHYQVVREPGRYATRPVQVWIDGRWAS